MKRYEFPDLLARLLSLLCLFVLFNGKVLAEENLPATHGMMTFFYYDRHAEAVDFYTNTLGFKEVFNDGWLVIVESAPGSRIALANSEKGSMKPVKNKGALIAVETEELEAWFELLKGRGVEFISGWEDGDYVAQFRIYDPGGYIVEFVRWKQKYRERFSDL